MSWKIKIFWGLPKGIRNAYRPPWQTEIFFGRTRSPDLGSSDTEFSLRRIGERDRKTIALLPTVFENRQLGLARQVPRYRRKGTEGDKSVAGKEDCLYNQ